MKINESGLRRIIREELIVLSEEKGKVASFFDFIEGAFDKMTGWMDDLQSDLMNVAKKQANTYKEEAAKIKPGPDGKRDKSLVAKRIVALNYNSLYEDIDLLKKTAPVKSWVPPEGTEQENKEWQNSDGKLVGNLWNVAGGMVGRIRGINDVMETNIPLKASGDDQTPAEVINEIDENATSLIKVFTEFEKEYSFDDGGSTPKMVIGRLQEIKAEAATIAGKIKSSAKEVQAESLLHVSKDRLVKAVLERFSAEDFKDVYNTARLAHVGQTRRDGSEYFTHPSEVRNIARGFYPRDNVVQMAALLHDSLEDAPGSTVDSVEEMEDFIRGSIQDPSSADEVIRVVRALTHEKGGSYTDYVLGLLGDIPTLRVKLSDMVHNLSDNPRPSQKSKYRSALDAISAQTGGNAPPGISPQHWQELLSLTQEDLT